MKAGLLLIEFQHEWLNPQGKLYSLMQDMAQLQRSIIQARVALHYARQTGMIVIHSGLSFTPDYHELGNTNQGLRAHIRMNQPFIENTVGSDFFTGFAPHDGELIVTGRLGSSAFAGSNLDLLCRYHKIDTLYMMGYALHVCVESTLRAAYDLGYNTNVITDACAAFTQTQQDHVINEVIPHFGTAITTATFIN